MNITSDIRIALYYLDGEQCPEVLEWISELSHTIGDRPLHPEWVGCDPASVTLANMVTHAEDDGLYDLLRRGWYLSLLVGEPAGNA